MRKIGIFIKSIPFKFPLIPLHFARFSGLLSAKLLDLKFSPNEKRTELFNETLPLLLEKPTNLSDLIVFFQDFEKNQSIHTEFVQYLGLFSNFFQKYAQTLSLKSLEKLQIISLVELFSTFPELLKKNIGFFNSLDVYFTRNRDFAPETLLKVLILAININRCSDKLHDFLEKIDDFSKISIESHINLAISLRNCEIISLDFAKIVYRELRKRNNEIKLNYWLETLYTAALLNIPDMKELFVSGLNYLKSTNFTRNFEIMKYLWILMYFGLKYNEKLEKKVLEGLISNLKNNMNNTINSNNHSFAYKIHEIELFLKKYYLEIYSNQWKFENFMQENEWFKGGLNKIGSILQKDVEIILKIANIPFEREKRIEKIYLVDFFIPEQLLILEINGPQHYSFNKKNQDILLNGTSFVKSEVLKSCGMKVRNISYKKWYEIKGVREKLEFVNNLVYDS